MRTHRSTIVNLGVSLALAATLLAGCGSDDEPTVAPPATQPTGGAAATFPLDITTAGGTFTVPGRPVRIVSLAPSTTEMLFAIGAGPQVVAVDDQSNFPPEVPRTDLSGFTPNLEAVAGYTPDLVVVSGDAGGLVAGLGQLRIPTAVFPAAGTLDDTYAQIEQLGAATGQVAEAAGLVARMQTDIAALLAEVPPRPEPLTYYHELDPTFYSVTSRTFIGAVYTAVGLVNIADGATGAGDYPRLSSEAIVRADPDLIFLADTRIKPTPQNAGTVAARPGWSTISAVRNGGVVVLDDDIASRWGPRIVDLLRQVIAAVKAVPAPVGATAGG
ncbi:MAG: ABC transporter substrate-binding protein [Acidimicrobiales bacterium]